MPTQTPPPKGFALLAFLLIAGLSAMVGAFIGANLDPHEARCQALFAAAVWEPVVDVDETYAFLLPPDDDVVYHNETATNDHSCHESFKAKYASLTERRRLQVFAAAKVFANVIAKDVAKGMSRDALKFAAKKATDRRSVLLREMRSSSSEGRAYTPRNDIDFIPWGTISRHSDDVPG